MKIKMLMVIAIGMLNIPLFAQCCGGKIYPVQPAAVTDTKKQTVKLPTMLELGATKCNQCKAMLPIIDSLTKEFKGVLSVKFIDVWMQENVAIARKFKIESIPTQIFLDKNGKELWRHEGFIPKEEILAQWKKLGYDLAKLKKEQKK